MGVKDMEVDRGVLAWSVWWLLSGPTEEPGSAVLPRDEFFSS